MTWRKTLFPGLHPTSLVEHVCVEVQESVSVTKSCFFEKVDIIDKPLARFIKKKRERTQINKIRNEKGEATTDITEIQRIIRDHYRRLYANKMHDMEEMDIFLERFSIQRLNQEEAENMNRPITSTEIENCD